MKNTLLKEIIEAEQNLKYFYVLSALYITVVLTSLTVSARLLPVHVPFTHFIILLTAGTWTIPLTFFIQDITTEIYGYDKSKQLVLLSVPVAILYVGYLKLTTIFPMPVIGNIDKSYNEVFNALPQHLLALLMAIAASNLVNNYLLFKLKNRFHGKYLPGRFIFSTAIGEAVLQVIGTTIAWSGTLHFMTELLPFIVFSYGYKVAFEAFMTPVNIYICNWL